VGGTKKHKQGFINYTQKNTRLAKGDKKQRVKNRLVRLDHRIQPPVFRGATGPLFPGRTQSQTWFFTNFLTKLPKYTPKGAGKKKDRRKGNMGGAKISIKKSGRGGRKKNVNKNRKNPYSHLSCNGGAKAGVEAGGI